MAHGDTREGKWRGNWRMEWVASTLHTTSEHGVSSIRVQLKCDVTRWHTGGEIKGKLENGVGTLPRNMLYPALLPLIRTPQLPAVDWTDAPADLNGLVRFAERRKLFSARVPSHFNWPAPTSLSASITAALHKSSSYLFFADLLAVLPLLTGFQGQL